MVMVVAHAPSLMDVIFKSSGSSQDRHEDQKMSCASPIADRTNRTREIRE